MVGIFFFASFLRACSRQKWPRIEISLDSEVEAPTQEEAQAGYSAKVSQIYLDIGKGDSDDNVGEGSFGEEVDLSPVNIAQGTCLRRSCHSRYSPVNEEGSKSTNESHFFPLPQTNPIPQSRYKLEPLRDPPRHCFKFIRLDLDESTF